MSATSIISNYFTPLSEHNPSPASFLISHPPLSPPMQTSLVPTPITLDHLQSILAITDTRPLMIDTRPPPVHLAAHVVDSVNLAIPSLLLKRTRKQKRSVTSTTFPTLHSLRQYITTDESLTVWDSLLVQGQPSARWDGTLVVYDHHMDALQKEDPNSASWTLLYILEPILRGISTGRLCYLEGGFAAALSRKDFASGYIVAGNSTTGSAFVGNGGWLTEPDAKKPKPNDTPSIKKLPSLGLFQLDTQTAARSKQLPEIDLSSSATASYLGDPPRSPMPVMPSAMAASSPISPVAIPNHLIIDSSPSPPPSQSHPHLSFRKPLPPSNFRRPSIQRLNTRSVEKLPSLPRLDIKSATRTKSAERLPKLSLRTTGIGPSVKGREDRLTPYYTPPHSPGTPKAPNGIPPSPKTARPDSDDTDGPPTTEDPHPPFTVSIILPQFLFLGPEPSAEDHLQMLKDHGVKRILNLAIECDENDHGLALAQTFEKYTKIAMRDHVEEEGVVGKVREVCDILDDARLHSAPTFVHCKAGKSRSVTAIIAYLIHANHWTLSKAYAFVLERRKGISPNIGFVSELMTFEEEELGGKSIGVQPSVPGGQQGDSSVNQAYHGVGAGGRRGGHIRESLPPPIGNGLGGEGDAGPMSAGTLLVGSVRAEVGQDMEIKDAQGRWRHARRAPVDEQTLQPMRRVSKAGLESSAYGYGVP
ncbi:hypothetical protein PLEOSDRAFT_1068092 [Pleurotus ostreatus PC15]|uniref:protein-tyrosine-phosphatase n=1 Tax=Pleurotus ostreatus (strain PC15) TaxID=1137138 RepID=A0A067N8E8_PLEO1|nr:hypothetical protein PLEOSDRAFT_1068092 [Pleurotus ostreatus PC15]